MIVHCKRQVDHSHAVQVLRTPTVPGLLGCRAQKIIQAPCLKRGGHPEATTDPAIVDPCSRAVPAGSRTSANALTTVSNLIPPEVPPRVP